MYLITEYPGGKIYLDPEQETQLKNRQAGHYEKDWLAYLDTHLKPGDVFVDCGANVGYYTLYTARIVGKTGKVIAFEPEPNNFTYLGKAVTLNGLQNVILHQYALWNERDKLPLHLSINNGQHSLMFPHHDIGKEITVFTNRLDDISSVITYPPSIIKIDTEGAEQAIIMGARNTLKTFPTLLLETHVRMGTDLQLLRDTLFTIGYDRIQENGKRWIVERGDD